MKREDSLCKECESGELEDVVHWMVRCLIVKSVEHTTADTDEARPTRKK